MANVFMKMNSASNSQKGYLIIIFDTEITFEGKKKLFLPDTCDTNQKTLKTFNYFWILTLLTLDQPISITTQMHCLLMHTIDHECQRKRNICLSLKVSSTTTKQRNGCCYCIYFKNIFAYVSIVDYEACCLSQ